MELQVNNRTVSTRWHAKILVALCALLSAISVWHSAVAAEIRLRREASLSGQIVRLGDLADIAAVDAAEGQRLAEIELFAAPAGSRRHYVTLDEIRNQLTRRGADLATLTFTGASQVLISAADGRSAQPDRPRLTSARVRAIEAKLRGLIVDYLEARTAVEDVWQVEISFDAEEFAFLATGDPDVQISGGGEPWTGQQMFTVQAQTSEGAVTRNISANVQLPPLVVVAARAVPRGALLSAVDLRLQPRQTGNQRGEPIRLLEEAVGRETTQSLSAGQIVTSRHLQRPVLVKSGDAVDVYARASGVQVKTIARARESGSAGDLVAVESLTDRKAYLARVIGIQEVEVYARASSARTETPTSQPQAGQLSSAGASPLPPQLRRAQTFPSEVGQAPSDTQSVRVVRNPSPAISTTPSTTPAATAGPALLPAATAPASAQPARPTNTGSVGSPTSRHRTTGLQWTKPRQR